MLLLWPPAGGPQRRCQACCCAKRGVCCWRGAQWTGAGSSWRRANTMKLNVQCCHQSCACMRQSRFTFQLGRVCLVVAMWCVPSHQVCALLVMLATALRCGLTVCSSVLAVGAYVLHFARKHSQAMLLVVAVVAAGCCCFAEEQQCWGGSRGRTAHKPI
jgi:hypothetical protein